MKRRVNWRRTAAEATGLLLAAGLAAGALWFLVSTDRSWVMFYSGDSMQLPLMRASLSEGAAQDWAMSSVLFVPEAALYLLVGLLGFGIHTTTVGWAFLTLMGLYVGYRWAASAVVSRSSAVTQIGGGLLAMLVVSLWLVSESSADQDSLEVASLIVTAGYYSSTVLGMVYSVSLVARSINVRGTGALARPTLAILCGVVFLSVFTNPLFLVWFVGPALVVLRVLWLAGKVAARTALVIIGVVLLGTVLGFAVRSRFSGFIESSGLNYIQLDNMDGSLEYFADAFGVRTSSIAGVLAAILLVVVLLTAIAVSVLAWRRKDAGLVFLGMFAVFVPVAVVVGSIALGLTATRYLMPVYFASALVVVAVPTIVLALARRYVTTSRARAVTAGALVVATAAVALFAMTATADASRTKTVQWAKTSVDCVSNWIDTHDVYVAGEFWTSRAAKAYSQHPSRVLQVDGNFTRMRWLVNRTDYAVNSITYVISYYGEPYILRHADQITRRIETYNCGRYDITKYGPAEILLIEPTDPDAPI